MSNALMVGVLRVFESRLRTEERKPPSRAMRMTFSKHLGVPLDLVPRGYFQWVFDAVIPIEPSLADVIRRAVAKEPVPDEAFIAETSDGGSA